MNNTMTYRGYRASMTLDADDHILVGRVLDIDDIVSFHGESVAEFEQAFQAAIDSYLEACAKLKQEPDKPASGRLMLRIDPVVHAAAFKAAKRSGQSLNKWAEQVLGSAAQR
jgi:predicted HicB family RNase H-like nuclease